MGALVTLRLGFVGCGKWARKLAESFRACGAEIVAYDRRGSQDPVPGETWEARGLDDKTEVVRIDGMGPGTFSCSGGVNGYYRAPGERLKDQFQLIRRVSPMPPLDGFGSYMPWRDQLADKNIDAIVAVAPPEITTEVALACAEAGKAVMATKPLMDHPSRITNVFAVDFWRLWADEHAKWRDVMRGSFHGQLRYDLSGCGPVRDFPGAFDYGPHVMAAVLDAMPRAELAAHSLVASGVENEELFSYGFRDPSIPGRYIAGEFGNAGTHGIRNVWSVEETPTHIGAQLKSDVMKACCQSFLNDVSEGFVSTKLLDLSRDGMKLLEQIRRMAT
jgi:hypothetical protein